MTIAAHETLFQEAVKYGNQKHQESQEGMAELIAELNAQKNRKKQLE